MFLQQGFPNARQTSLFSLISSIGRSIMIGFAAVYLNLDFTPITLEKNPVENAVY